MNSNDLLDVIGEAKEKHILDAVDTRNGVHLQKKRLSMNRAFLIAAAIALMLFLMGCAWVVMRLQHMTTDAPPFTDYWGEERSIISLQGFEGSKNYEAFQEWQQFLDSYDPDNQILYESNDFYLECPEAYYSYECYSWEMVDKIREICEKYDLEPLGKPWVFRQADHLLEAVGIETVFSSTATPEDSPFSGYCYNDGTFEMEGDITL